MVLNKQYNEMIANVGQYCLSNRYKTKTATCNACGQVNDTVFFALNRRGVKSYENVLNKCTVNVHIPNTIDGLRVCIMYRYTR